MTEQEWLSRDSPTRLLESLKGKVSDRKLRQLACASVRLFWQYCDAAQSLVETFEAYADGLASYSEVSEKRDAVAALALGRHDLTRVALDACLDLTRMEVTDSTAYWICRSLVAEVARVEIYALGAAGIKSGSTAYQTAIGEVLVRGATVVRDIFGNPFRPVAFDPAWRTDTAVALARQMYESREFSAMPILADALQDAGCDNTDVLNHCRDANATHVRGCWVADLVLGKE